MAPASRGWHIHLITRHASSLKPPRKKPLMKHNSPPTAGRIPPQTPRPQPSFRTRPPDARPTDPVLPKTPSRTDRLLRRVPQRYRRMIGTTILLTPIAVLVALHFPWKIMTTNGSSMSPLLNPNSANGELPDEKQKILVRSLAYDSPLPFDSGPRPKQQTKEGDGVQGTALRRGQIVVFNSPMDPDRIAVKRIVGIPGDRVQPLQGYAGGSGPAVIPYNQIWVEGDVDNRDKSYDSNWYGPISAHLVVGEVVALIGPWWKPIWITIEEHTYPAKQKGRVEENVVKEAMDHPDELDRGQEFLPNGKATRDLELIQSDMAAAVSLVRNSSDQRQRAVDFYRGARAELLRDDPATIETAREMVNALESVLVKAGFDEADLKAHATPKGSADLKNWEEKEKALRRQRPLSQHGVVPVEVLSAPTPPASEVRELPAARALRLHREKIERDKAAGIPNGLDESERWLMWQEQDRIMRESAERIKAENAAKREAARAARAQ